MIAPGGGASGPSEARQGRAAEPHVRLSIGVPAYNQGRYLRQTIESLLAQTHPPYEIVVSDNHSTDETPAVIEEFKDLVRIIRPPTHLDVYPHFDFLVGHLQGDWASILSSDDVAFPHFVESMQEGARASERAVLVRADYERIDGEGRAFAAVRLKGIRRVSSPPENFYEQLRRPKTGFASFAVRVSAWRDVGGFGKEVVYLGDWSFWLRISPRGDFVHVPRMVSQYRSNYRPGIDRERLGQTLRDEVVLRHAIIPRVASILGVAGDARLRRASRSRCHDVLRTIEKLLPVRDRPAAIATVGEWVSETGLGLSVRLLQAGRRIPRELGYAGLVLQTIRDCLGMQPREGGRPPSPATMKSPARQGHVRLPEPARGSSDPEAVRMQMGTSTGGRRHEGQ